MRGNHLSLTANNLQFLLQIKKKMNMAKKDLEVPAEINFTRRHLQCIPGA